MLVVRSLDGTEEMLTDYTPPERKRRVNGDHSLTFTIFATDRNEHSYSICEKEAVIILGDDEYKIKGVRKSGTGRKQIECVHIFLEDMASAYQYDLRNGYTNFVQALDHVFAPTQWTWVNQTATVATEFENWGDDWCLALLQTLLNRYKVEFEIDNKNKRVYFKTAIGTETDAQFRWKHNIKSYELEEDTKNLSTIIKGFGKDGITATYRSPAADVYGEKHAKPIRDERYTTVETLTQALQDTIIDVPELRLKTDIVQLYEQGLPVHDYDVGDYVFALINPADLQAKIRIIELTDYPLNPEKSPIVELSNLRLLRKGITSAFANFAQIQKQVKDLLDENGNMQLAVKKLYSNTNVFWDNTGLWFIHPDNPNVYAHHNHYGSDYHGGMIRIERPDGYAIMIDGVIQSGFELQGAYPPFRTAGIVEIGPWLKSNSDSRFENVQMYTFKHDSRYLVARVGMYTDGGATGYMSFDLDTSNGDGQTADVLATVTRSSTDQGWNTFVTMDLGVPDGLKKTIYVRLYTSDVNNAAYGRILYISQEG